MRRSELHALTTLLTEISGGGRGGGGRGGRGRGGGGGGGGGLDPVI